MGTPKAKRKFSLLERLPLEERTTPDFGSRQKSLNAPGQISSDQGLTKPRFLNAFCPTRRDRFSKKTEHIS